MLNPGVAGYSSIYREGAQSLLSGEISSDDGRFATIFGTIDVVNTNHLDFNGSITISTNDNCGIIEKEGNFKLLKGENNNFWRLYSKDNNCSFDIAIIE